MLDLLSLPMIKLRTPVVGGTTEMGLSNRLARTVENYARFMVGPVGFEPTTSGPDFSESPAPQVHRPNTGLWYPLGGVMIPGPS